MVKYPSKRAEYQRQYRQKNLERIRKREQAYYQKNIEKILAYKHKNYKRTLEIGTNWRKNNPEKVKAAQKRYRQTHQEALQKKEKERVKKNPEKTWARKAIQHKKELGFSVLFTTQELTALALLHQPCRYCGKKLDYSPFKGRVINVTPSLDRINNNTGILTLNDIQIICYKCNLKKSDQTHSEFLEYCKNVIQRCGPQ